MPQPVTEAIEPTPVVQRAHVAVDVEVGDIPDLRQPQPPLTPTRGGAPDLKRPELGGEVPQLQVGQLLIV